MENCTYLNQLAGRNLFVVSVSQMCEEQLLYDPVYKLAISNFRSDAVFSNAYPALMAPFFGVIIGVRFLKEEVKIY